MNDNTMRLVEKLVAVTRENEAFRARITELAHRIYEEERKTLERDFLYGNKNEPLELNGQLDTVPIRKILGIPESEENKKLLEQHKKERRIESETAAEPESSVIPVVRKKAAL